MFEGFVYYIVFDFFSMNSCICRNLFRLPVEEKLDGHCECTLWSPHEKCHEWGTLYCSPNYLCFNSKVGEVHHQFSLSAPLYATFHGFVVFFAFILMKVDRTVKQIE